jgi:peptidyl-prolyl cis-trans isomerase A (cyclophilin A)
MGVIVSSVLSVLAVLCLSVCVTAAEAEVPGADPGTEGLREGWYARISTSMGEIVARLAPDQAPQSVAHFAALARGDLEWTDPVSGDVHDGEPYYDGAPVHYAKAGVSFEVGRIPGSGGAAPLIYVPLEGPGPINFYEGGRLGMGRSPLGRTSAVIFFVAVTPQPWLNENHPCFAEIVSGLDVAFRISEVRTYTNNGRPIDDVRVESIEVFPVGDPLPLPEVKPYLPRQARPTPVK